MKTKLQIVFSLTFLLLASCGMEKQSDSTVVPVVPDFQYNLQEDDTYTLVSCNNKEIQEFEIPSVYQGKIVTRIEAEAFKDCTSLMHISIPDSITYIGDHAFENNASLTEIRIPNSVKGLGLACLRGCNALTKVSIPTMRWNDEEIETPYFSELFFDDTIGQHILFRHKTPESLTEVEITSDTAELTYACFGSEGNIRKITLPEGIKEIPSSAFEWCDNLTEINIPGTVTVIDDEAFEGCYNLKKIDIPNGVTEFGWATFFNTGIEECTLPEGLNEIPHSLFGNCRSLTNVIIPASVQGIEDTAFKGCSSLSDIYYRGSEEQWNEVYRIERDYKYLDEKPQIPEGVTIHYNYIY